MKLINKNNIKLSTKKLKRTKKILKNRPNQSKIKIICRMIRKIINGLHGMNPTKNNNFKNKKLEFKLVST